MIINLYILESKKNEHPLGAFLLAIAERLDSINAHMALLTKVQLADLSRFPDLAPLIGGILADDLAAKNAAAAAEHKAYFDVDEDGDNITIDERDESLEETTHTGSESILPPPIENIPAWAAQLKEAMENQHHSSEEKENT